MTLHGLTLQNSPEWRSRHFVHQSFMKAEYSNSIPTVPDVSLSLVQLLKSLWE